ncbi:hypothetical protein ACGRSR_06575 [Vibrio owensii]|uniref:hypothetical protein n=1 Tax=Vibrio owensii TaxID=696485 RepID=UPI00374806C6
MESTVSNPIHLPCPDMAGCINPDPSKTANSLRKIRELRERFADQFPKKTRSYIPARFRQGVIA